MNSSNSRQVAFSELSVSGVTDSIGASLLLKLANAPGMSETIADSLTQNFSRDYHDLLAKVTRAVAAKRTGAFIIRARIDEVQTGRIVAAGQGLYLPVVGKGVASVELRGR